MSQPTTPPPPPTYERALEVLTDPAHGPADQDAFLDCIDLIARLYGKTYDEVYTAAYARCPEL